LKSDILLLRRPPNDAIVIAGLAISTLIILSASLSYGSTMFHFDSYRYFALALDVSNGSRTSYSPFILFISLLIKMYPDSDSLLLFTRIINLTFAAQLVVFSYLIARKIFNNIFSVVTAFLALLLPLVHAYSLQLHNDIFTVAMAFTAMYFIITPTVRNFIMAILFISLACATRPDYALILLLPLALTVAGYYTRDMSFKSKIASSLMILALISAVGYLVMGEYYKSTTRFGVFERIFLFLRYDLVDILWQNSIAVTNHDILNVCYALITIIGILLLIGSNYKKLVQRIKLWNFRPTESERTALFLTFCFFVSFFSAIVFHTGYSIVDDRIIISYTIGQRYLIPIQLFFIFGFVYAISNLTIKNIMTIRDHIVRIVKPRSF
jgi:hypothetical protein